MRIDLSQKRNTHTYSEILICYCEFFKEVKFMESTDLNKVSVSCLQVRNGIYQAVLEYYDENGKRHLPWRSTGLKERGNKKQALVVAEELKEKLKFINLSAK